MGPQIPSPYCGRFAPSPTGPLHFGSLVTAVASWLEARTRGGRWLLRMEDLDRPRCNAQADADIRRALDVYGLHHDGVIIWQSQRDAAYADALARLRDAGLVYPCACSRKELADSQLGSDGSQIYPGTCREGVPSGRTPRAWRLRVDDAQVSVDDVIQGRHIARLASDTGDFVVRRADGLFAYQLAVVVDDADAGVTDIVRGADLHCSTARQIFLQRCLGIEKPRYAHVPVVLNAAGEKLSKQTLAAAIDLAQPASVLCRALSFLGQTPPRELAAATVTDVWQWAMANWRLERVPGEMGLQEQENDDSSGR